MDDLLGNLQPTFFKVHQQLQEVRPLRFTVVFDLKHVLQGVGMSLVDAHHLPPVPHLRLVVLLVQMQDLLSHQVRVAELDGSLSPLHGRAQHPAPPVLGAVADRQVRAELDL